MPRPPRATLFPYTTLFRSAPAVDLQGLQQPAPFRVGLSAGVGTVEPEHVERDERDLAAAVVSAGQPRTEPRSEEHTSELQSHVKLVCRLPLEKKKPRRCPRCGASPSVSSFRRPRGAGQTAGTVATPCRVCGGMAPAAMTCPMREVTAAPPVAA